MTRAKKRSGGRPSTPRESLQEYGRGLAGGLLFSLPLLYTMEVWWTGFTPGPYRLLLLLLVTLVLLLGYNRYSGMREDASWVEVAIDSIEELGLGTVTAALVLYAIGQIGSISSFDEVLGKVVVEASIVAIGFSVGTAQLGAGDSDSGMKGESHSPASRITGELLIAACGAVLFAANVAPTEEIQAIAIRTDAIRALGIMALSLAVGSVVLYFSNFKSSDRSVRNEGGLDVIRGTTITYAIGLVVSAAILWFFGRFEGDAAIVIVRQILVLAFPATLGAAAGRLLLSS